MELRYLMIENPTSEGPLNGQLSLESPEGSMSIELTPKQCQELLTSWQYTINMLVLDSASMLAREVTFLPVVSDPPKFDMLKSQLPKSIPDDDIPF